MGIARMAAPQLLHRVLLVVDFGTSGARGWLSVQPSGVALSSVVTPHLCTAAASLHDPSTGGDIASPLPKPQQ